MTDSRKRAGVVRRKGSFFGIPRKRLSKWDSRMTAGNGGVDAGLATASGAALVRADGWVEVFRPTLGLRAGSARSPYLSAGINETRKPRESLRLPGESPERYADRQRSAKQNQPPPRFTRFEPAFGPRGFSAPSVSR